MKEKIKKVSILGWLLIISTSFGLSILVDFIYSNLTGVVVFSPWSSAYHVATSIAIDIFSEGTAGDIIYIKERLTALSGLILFYIIGPGLIILYGMSSDSDSSDKPANKLLPKKNMAGFSIGIIITLAGILPFTAEAFLAPVSHENSRIHASRSATKDDLRYNLALLASQSYEYLVLPKEAGGGEGSFKKLAIEDLARYQDIESGDYTLEKAESDTLLRIIGTAKPPYPADATEEVKLTVLVQPSDAFTWE